MNKKLIATLVMSTVVASAFAMNAGAASTKAVLKDETGKVHNVNGSIGKVAGATAEARAMAALDKVGADFGFAKAAGNFKLKASHKDETGTAHTKLDQTINGITVFGHQMIVHENNGSVSGVTGDFAKVTPNATTATLSADDAIKAAVASTGFTGELKNAPKAELVYVAQGDKAVLAYNTSVSYAGDAPARWSIFVDATNGSIVNSINQLENYTNAVATGTGVLGTTKSINVANYTGTYYLEDHTKAGMAADGITTYDMKNGTTTGYYVTDTDLTWNSTAQKAAVDANYYAAKVWDYYKTNYGRNSYDNLGSALYSYVHYSTAYNNAYWDGAEMVYGDGDGVQFRALSGAFDVVAHELSHAVTEKESALIYSNQSGALNESFSDAMGVAIEGVNWMVGEDVYTPATSGDALRYMDNPALGGQPANMSGYVNTTSDNGGVHTNSGIPNKAFYNASVASGMSRAIAAKIWYTANRDYWTSSATFSSARAGTLSAAAALYGSGSTQYNAVAAAWTAVGVN